MNSYQSLAEMVDHLSGRGAAAALIVFRDHNMEAWTCADLANDISLLATGLVEAGVRRGEPVLICAPNSPEWIIAYFAIVCSGALAVPLDDLSSGEDLARVFADSGARRIFSSQSHLPALKSMGEEAAIDIIMLDGADGGRTAKDWHSLLAESRGHFPDIGRDDLASLLYTSGTTGTPKAVPLTHGNILANVEAVAASKIAGPEDRVLLPLPLHHSYPFTVGLLCTLACGGTLVFPAGISGPQITEALTASKSTILIGVPRLYTALLSAIDHKVAKLGAVGRAAFRLLLKISMLLRKNLGVRIGRFIFQRLHRELGPNLRILACGGARIDPDVAMKLEALGWEVLTGYGLTETSPIVTFNPRGRARIDSAGLPLPGVELRVDAKPGQPSGEILVRGPNVFAGYRNNPEATMGAFTPDGWFRTGDLGFVDRDGYLHIVGRVKEIIVLPDGKNVIPEDVENAYASSPLIREVAIIERQGILAGLFVPDDEEIRAQGSARAQSLLREEIEDISLRLPPYQRLTAFRVTREPLPRTHLGKLRRHLLSDVYNRAERGAAPPVAQELSENDRRLLALEPTSSVWGWLVQRFSGTALTLDTSPQLDLQMDSLEWMTLSLEIQERFDVSLTSAAIARIVTIRDLLHEVSAATKETPGRQLIADGQKVTTEDAGWLRPMGPIMFLLGMLVFALNWLVLRTAFRLRVEGAERLPRDGPYIVAPNHQSFLDPFAVAAALPVGRYQNAYWAGWTGELFSGPFSRFFSRISRVFPVDPDRGPASSLALGKAVLERRRILVWFPEGRLSRTGALGRFLPGVGVLLRHSDVVAVPALVSGTFEALPRGRRVPRLRPITVVFGHPMNADELEMLGQGEDTHERIADGLRQAVAALGDHEQAS